MTRSTTRWPSGRRPKQRKPTRSATLRAPARITPITLCVETPATGTALGITTPADVATLLGAEMGALTQEQLRVLLLDTKHRVRACHLIYQGTVNGATIRVVEIVRPAVIANLPAILMIHNHPSGDPTPSPEDIHATQRIAEAAALLDLELLDHVILGAAGRYYSLKEAGLLRVPASLLIAA